MESFLILIAGFLLIITLWYAWRYYHIHREIIAYTNYLNKKAKDGESEAYETNSKEIVGLIAAIDLCRENLNNQLIKLNSERARLATVLEQMTDGVLIVNTEGIIEFANPAAEQLFGNQELSDKTITEGLRHYQLIECWQACVNTGRPQSEVVELAREHKFLQIVATPDRYLHGGCLLLLQDLTQLRRLETVRRDFISNISHELRTPLASLKALTETLQNGALNDPEVAQRFLNRIEIEVDAITQMAQELLDLSRIESGQVVLDLKTVEPIYLLQTSSERMQLQATRAQLDILVKTIQDLPLVFADEDRIEQVLVNLIHNAIKFTPLGGKITLQAELAAGGTTDQRFIRFAVQDTGKGISADDLARIFERFYKTDRARASRGTGLGLSIARHIVEAHGGKIWAESREGHGSTFYFTLPVAAGELEK